MFGCRFDRAFLEVLMQNRTMFWGEVSEHVGRHRSRSRIRFLVTVETAFGLSI